MFCVPRTNLSIPKVPRDRWPNPSAAFLPGPVLFPDESALQAAIEPEFAAPPI
jgi:hypothetical protein